MLTPSHVAQQDSESFDKVPRPRISLRYTSNFSTLLLARLVDEFLDIALLRKLFPKHSISAAQRGRCD